MSATRKSDVGAQAAKDNGGAYCIKDTGTQIVLLIMFAVCLIIAVGFFFAAVSAFFAKAPVRNTGNIITYSSWFFIFFAVSVIPYKIYEANKQGIIIDLNNDVLEFPGGGIAANDISDYFKSKFLLQLFKRSSVNISSIREISRDNKVTTRRDKDGKLHVSTSYIFSFNGDFGAVDLRFFSEGKRDELYSILREINEMGIPVVNQ